MENGNQIDDYLLGRLSKKEKEQFEKKLKTDIQFRKETLFKKDIINGVQEIGRQKQLAEFKRIRENPTNVVYIPANQLLKIVAAIVVVVATIWLIPFFFQPSPQSIFDKQIAQSIPESIATTLRSSDEPIDKEIYEIWAKADEYYRLGNYVESIKALQKIEEGNNILRNEDWNRYYYFRSLLFLKLTSEEYINNFLKFPSGSLQNVPPRNQIEEALKLLSSVNPQSELYAEDAQWLEAITLLIEDEKRAKETLQEIANSNSPRKEEAEDILKQLRL